MAREAAALESYATEMHRAPQKAKAASSRHSPKAAPRSRGLSAPPLGLTFNHPIFQKQGDYEGREEREERKEIFMANLRALRALRSHLFPVTLMMKDGITSHPDLR